MNIKEYISQNGGYISSAEAKEKSLYNQLLYEVEKGTIVRLRQGIYALNEGLAKPMVDVERLVPGGVLCAYSAWSHYGLTTQIPLSYCIAIERSRKVSLPEFPPIELFFLSKSVFELGVSEAVIEGFFQQVVIHFAGGVVTAHQLFHTMLVLVKTDGGIAGGEQAGEGKSYVS